MTWNSILDYDHFAKYLAEDLEADINGITPETRPSELGAEPSDFGDYFFKLGIPHSKFTKSGNLTYCGRRILSELNRVYSEIDPDVSKHFKDLAASSNLCDFLDELTIIDLFDIRRKTAA